VGLLQRVVSGDPRTESVGEFFTRRLTPDELRQETAVLVSDLESPGLDATRRATEEANLETFETYASAHHLALPAATARHLRQVAMALAADLKVLAGAQREAHPDSQRAPGFFPFAGKLTLELTWSVDQLGWAVQATEEAIQLTGAGKFQEAGATLTAAMAVATAVATHLRFLQFAVSVQNTGRDLGVSDKVRTVREILQPYVVKAQYPPGWPSVSAEGVSELLDPSKSWSWDFSTWADDVQERAAANDRFVKWVGIIQLGLLVFDIWMLPVAGEPRPGGGGGPIGAPAGGGAGVGVVASAEVLESLRRLAALGVLTAPALVKLIGGPSPAIQAPPKPMQTGGGAGPPKPMQTGGGTRGPLEGATHHDVFDAQGKLITDIDLIENDVLWEKKSAENAGDIKDWVATNITAKVEKYLRVRAAGSTLPAYYRNAKIGFIFERAPREELWGPIMDEIERLQQLHPDTIEWYVE
jgi:hypothetical protein